MIQNAHRQATEGRYSNQKTLNVKTARAHWVPGSFCADLPQYQMAGYRHDHYGAAQLLSHSFQTLFPHKVYIIWCQSRITNDAPVSQS